jgi:tetratricopeptide (TPR) repeat protein
MHSKQMKLRIMYFSQICRAFLLCGLLSAISYAAQNTGKNSQSANRLETIKQWRQAAGHHIPGKADSFAVTIGHWNEKDLNTAIEYITKLAAQPISTIKSIVKKDANRRALELTDHEVEKGDLALALKQGALLHTDIALLGLATGISQDSRQQIAYFIDGQVIIPPQKTNHWNCARRLIEALHAHSPKDGWVKQWYISTIVHLQSEQFLFYAGQNLEDALKFFPSDAQLLFYAGILHEFLASPLLQNVELPPRGTKAYGSSESELKQARRFLEQAVALTPNFSEARLHLGRVLGLLGYPQESIAELQTAQAAIKDSQLLYYASLYLGHELKMVSRFEEARKQFEQAASLFPSAQTPLIALSQLARPLKDPDGEKRFVQRVFALKRTNSMDDDPWWIYRFSHVRDASLHIEEMYKKYGESLP